MAALAAVAACSASAVAAAGEPASPAEPLEIVLVGAPLVRAMLREAVAPLLPERERVLWIHREDPAASFADAVLPPRRLRIRIEVPDGGEARVTAYRPQGPPIVRAIDGGQPAPVIVESVAQVVRETVRALLAEAELPAATVAPPRGTPAAAGPTSPVVLSTSPVTSAPRATTFAISVSYLQRAILNQGSLPGADVPPERGSSASISARIPVGGSLYLSGGLVGDIAQASVGSPFPSSPDEIYLHILRYAAYAMFGLGWGPMPAFHFDLLAGEGYEKVNHSSPALEPATEQYLTARGALTFSAAVTPLSPGLEVVGGLLVDVGAAQDVSQAAFHVKTNRVQPGFTLGLAWRR